ncbi:MAG: hypothetical protein HC778_02985 [Chamaesiphon sp. CSU_1_12]|nr:hypothetical protein [Chamaesiphon sp. CSU_1_12]
MLEVYIRLGVEWDFVDCDRTNPNVGYAYDSANYREEEIARYWADLAALDTDSDLESLVAAVAQAKVAVTNTATELDSARANYDRSQTHEHGEALKSAQAAATAAPTAYNVAVKALMDAKAGKLARTAPRKRIYFDGKTIAEQQLPDELIELALVKDTIVNLPAQAANWVNRWIASSGLLSMEATDGLKPIFWFVVKPQADRASLNQFYDFYNAHQGKALVVLVKSRPTAECSWENYFTELDLQFIVERQIVCVEIANLELNEATNLLLHKDHMRFCDLLDLVPTPEFGITKLRRVRSYVDACVATILATKLLPEVTGTVRKQSTKVKKEEATNG